LSSPSRNRNAEVLVTKVAAVVIIMISRIQAREEEKRKEKKRRPEKPRYVIKPNRKKGAERVV